MISRDELLNEVGHASQKSFFGRHRFPEEPQVSAPVHSFGSGWKRIGPAGRLAARKPSLSGSKYQLTSLGHETRLDLCVLEP